MSKFDSNDLPRGRITAQVILTSFILICLLAFSEKCYSEPMSWQSFAVVALVYLTVTFVIWFLNWENF